MKQTSPALLITVFLLALLAGGWFSLTRQSLRKREVLLQEIEQRSAALTLLRQAPTRARVISDTPTAVDPVAGRLAPATQRNTVVAEIWKAAADNGVQTDSTRMQPEKRTMGYVDQEIDLSFTGRLSDLRQFIGRVEAMKRVIRISRFNLTQPSGEAPAKLEMTASILFNP